MTCESFYTPLLPDSGSSVLELGCGTGKLLEILKSRSCNCIGVDKDYAKVACCIAKGLPVCQLDYTKDLSNLNHGLFDYAIFHQPLHEISEFKESLDQAFNVSKKVLVLFDNSAYLPFRIDRFFMRNDSATFRYSTLSINSFKSFCRDLSLDIVQEHFSNHFLPNLLSRQAAFVLSRKA